MLIKGSLIKEQASLKISRGWPGWIDYFVAGSYGFGSTRMMAIMPWSS